MFIWVGQIIITAGCHAHGKPAVVNDGLRVKKPRGKLPQRIKVIRIFYQK